MSLADEMCVLSGECIGIAPIGHHEPVGAPSWNLGSEFLGSTANEAEFIHKIMGKLAEYKQVDVTRVFGVGMSNGAGLAHDLAVRTNIFLGIGAYTTALIHGRELPGENRNVSIFQVMGMKDEVVPYKGGPGLIGHNFMSAEKSVALWGKHNGCSSKPNFPTASNVDRRIEYTGCSDSTRVLHFGIAEGGHDIPSELDGQDTLKANWEFFKYL